MNCPHCKKKIGEIGIDLAKNHPVFIQRDALLEAAKRTASALRDINDDIRYLVYADDLDKAIQKAGGE